MDNYKVNVYWSDEDNRFLVEMSELPGCMADGDTAAEAMLNIQVAAQDWVKMATYMGREVPAPKPISYAWLALPRLLPDMHKLGGRVVYASCYSKTLPFVNRSRA